MHSWKRNMKMQEFEYPLDKMFHFVAGVVPGAAVLLLRFQSQPALCLRIAYDPFLGYKTKLCIFVLFCFVIGNAITTVLGGFVGAFAGALGALSQRFSASRTDSAAPWRDRRWRKVALLNLQERAPADTTLITEELYLLRSAAFESLPPEQRRMENYSLSMERLRTQRDDREWASWYEQLHFQVLQEQEDDFTVRITSGFSSNITATALVVIIGMIVKSTARPHWLCGACVLWIAFAVVRVVAELYRISNPWSTIDKQIARLHNRA